MRRKISTFFLSCVPWFIPLLALIPVVHLQNGKNPFYWFPPDNFDVISRKMDLANPENCVTMSETDLRLPPTSLSQLPRYNDILLQQWFSNRSKLLHLHNLALNRAFFYSYIQQRLDGPVIDPPFLPSFLYYYLSAAADVSSGPNVMNASAVLMDTNTTYANWYGLKVINRTLPLFGPTARRLDNWNDENNFLRVPTNKTIKCVPLTGFGFRRGGYECVCQPGHRLPANQNGPFRGVDIEAATEEEYKNGFDCLPVGWREVIPEETGLKDGSTTTPVVRRSARSVWSQSAPSLWDHLRQVARQVMGFHPMIDLLVILGILSYKVVGPGLHMPTEYGPDALPETVLNDADQKTTEVNKQRPLSDLFRKNFTVPGYHSVSHLLPLEPTDLPILATRLETAAMPTTNNSVSITTGQPPLNQELIVDNRTNADKLVRRVKRDWGVPFYTVGEGTVFNSDRFFEVLRLIAHAKKVTSKNCHTMTANQLEFPGEVSYGAEKQFEMVGRTALRLSHFLSAYYQNNVVGEVYGSLLTGFPINRFELFGEVIANVLSNFDIVSSGVFFDYQMFTDHDGITWDLFAPFAYKPVGSTQAVEAIDMSINTYRDYVEKPWFRTLKDRWVSSRFGLERITTKPYIRSDVNGTQLQRYFNFPIYYRVPYYEDGYWTQPYFDCQGLVKDWLITYASPFFGVFGEERALRFMGVTTVSVRMLSLDINQCPQSFYTPNFFKNTARCDFTSSYVSSMCFTMKFSHTRLHFSCFMFIVAFML
ncbi:Fras1 extracellular matrix protein [Fasciola hepatica]|uniref:Fras1 extracellular matrix protein n=1 Tax=Fasciola hepatica TaxID=6192 RepID=A0A4E0RXF1_FASHE|nr:Fras1 extracellular matrix protein [Fasciola hepatica]